MKELEKAYEPQKYEGQTYDRWEKSGFFNPDRCEQAGQCAGGKSFSMMLPPPNVTGTLHMGHASMLAIQDLIVRYHRMKGDKTLWLPGTDHAAIATQTRVEKELIKQGIKDPRRELGRVAFLLEVDKFARQSQGTIIHQTKKMGSSLDWSREAFTLDEARQTAVYTAFKRMYNDQLIYRGYRIVNWCPRCHSTLADDEVEYKGQKTKLYIFKYDKDFPLEIATTRPETKLGDTAVAVNPKDDRYRDLVGKIFKVKNFAGGTNLNIKIIADESVDPQFGTGALGVTPAHSHADYELAQKHGLEVIKIIDEDGLMTSKAGGKYSGIRVEQAREQVVKALEEQGLLSGEQEVDNNLSVCYRCSNAIEPLPSEQWFVDVNKRFKFRQSKKNPIHGLEDGQMVSLKKLMDHAVRSGQIEIIPEKFNKIYFNWIDNLRDWCVSRQIWYGHRMPVWYKGDQIYVGTEEPKGGGWKQETDTLDTWFSAGLWTFSTLGWPEDTRDLQQFHPTSVMETGYDIIFFWVARMILMSTYSLGEIPFETVYLHGLVRDEQGRKMSKSLDNVIDPLDMVEKYGADATRLSLLIGNTPGSDMKLSEEKIAGFRNFTNKLWNISRYILMNIDRPKKDQKLPEISTAVEKYLISKLNHILLRIGQGKNEENMIQNFQFSQAGEVLREFTWHVLADDYLEASKFEESNPALLNYILNTILKLWHPFMPFITEALWQKMYGSDSFLMVEKLPRPIGPKDIHESEAADYELLIEGNIKMIRSGINELGKVGEKVDVMVVAEGKHDFFQKYERYMIGKANLESLRITEKVPTSPEWKPIELASADRGYIKVSDSEVDKIKQRLKSELENKNQYLTTVEKKLSNADFVKNAPEEVVKKEKIKKEQTEEKIQKLEKQLQNLK